MYNHNNNYNVKWTVAYVEEMYDSVKKYTESYKSCIWILKHGHIGKESLVCSCGQNVLLNGVCSHSKICNQIANDKNKYLLKKINDTIKHNHKCIICGIDLTYQYDQNLNIKTMRTTNLITCSDKCRYIASHILSSKKHIINCPVCMERIFKNTKCSNECSSKKLSISLKKFWQDPANKILLENKTKKIVKTARENGSYDNRVPWNKGLKGIDYLKHYDKEDGSNSFFHPLSMPRDKRYQKTTIEVKIETLLNELNVNFVYDWYGIDKQFDFIVYFNNYILAIECDGDYWHGSTRRVFDENERTFLRNNDKLKDNLFIEKCKPKCNKEINIIRFWEFNINNNLEYIKSVLEFIIEKDKIGDREQIKSKICEIKEYYKKNS